jgi:cysteine-rich repeat protein
MCPLKLNHTPPGCPCGAGDGCNTGMTCQSGLCDVPPCAAGADGCACRLNDACDGGLYCDNSICRLPPPSTCGDGVREGLEACDDGNQVTEACDYGVGECSVCDRDCKRVWGVAKFCGDGVRQADHGEACDTAGAGCAYGQQTCEVCVDCSWTTGNGPYCGDGTVQTQETCDGDVWCDDGCDGPWGQDFEDNDDTDDATKIETDAPGASFSNPKNGSFTHPTDVVEGPYAFVDGVFYDDDPDYFKVKVCAGATLTARIEFDNSQGNLNLYAGKRGTATGPNVIPGVSFNTVSDGLNADYEEVTVTNNDGTWRFYYILVQVYDDAPAPIINAYDLTGSLSGCPE